VGEVIEWGGGVMESQRVRKVDKVSEPRRGGNEACNILFFRLWTGGDVVQRTGRQQQGECNAQWHFQKADGGEDSLGDAHFPTVP